MIARKVIPGLLTAVGLGLPLAVTAEVISHNSLGTVGGAAPPKSTPATQTGSGSGAGSSGASGSNSSSGSGSNSSGSGSSSSGSGSSSSGSTGNSGTSGSGHSTHHQTRPSGSTPTPQPTKAGKTGTFTGPPAQGMFGPVQARLIVRSGRITDVQISAPQDNPTSAYINQQAVPLLRSETLQAQSANINAISGATITSDAYYQSLVTALKEAGI